MKLTNKTLKKFILEFLEEQSSEESKKETQEAFENTSEEYLSKSIQQRNPGQQSAGSTFKEPQTPDSLKNADWKPLSHNPEAIKDPAKGFEAPIAGFLGALDIKEVPDELDAVIQPAHAGKGIHRQTGKLMAELAAVLPDGQPSTDFTTLIIGPTREDPEKNQIYTFHPGPPFASGEPIFMQDMKTKFNTEEDVIPVKIKDAKELGFELVKHVSNLPVTKTVKENKMKLTRQKLKQFIREELSQVKEMYYGWGAEWDPHTDQPGGGSALGREEETPSPSPSKSLKSGDKCPDCYGRGVQELEQWDSQMLTMVPYDTVECPTCKGTGKVLEETINETEDVDDEAERFYAKMGHKKDKPAPKSDKEASKPKSEEPKQDYMDDDAERYYARMGHRRENKKLTRDKLQQIVREQLAAMMDESRWDPRGGDDERGPDREDIIFNKRIDLMDQEDALHDQLKKAETPEAKEKIKKKIEAVRNKIRALDND